jgi:hypothetical protein
MPDNENGAAEQVGQAVDRFSVLRKAGLPPWAIFVIMLMSTPGFIGLFDQSANNADTKATQANKRADVSYEALAGELRELRNDYAQLETRIQNQHTVLMLLLQKGIGVENPSVVDEVDVVVNTPVHRTAPSRSRGSSEIPNAEVKPAPLVELVPPEVLRGMQEHQDAPPVQEQRKALPPKLDGLMK